uniref:Chromo domain-containing protein n=1 Tax=Panagrellus redivivus TaxID=6233 RepID=A0A7E4ULZ9_PANRE
MSSSDSNNNLFEVKKVIGRKEVDERVLYKVVWRGYSRNDATWEPYENFIGDGALNCIKIFLEKRKARKTAKKADGFKFIVDSDDEEEELKRQKFKKRKLVGIEVADDNSFQFVF